jgi:hypothetical protein
VFRCKQIVGIPEPILEADYAVSCHQGEHLLFSTIALAFLGLYVIGFPLGMFLMLWKNRQHLNNPKSKKHEAVKASLGGLYLQYSDKFWWFEMVSIIHKMIMT